MGITNWSKMICRHYIICKLKRSTYSGSGTGVPQMSNYLFCVFSSPTDRWTSTTTLVSSNSVYGFSRISLLLTNLINLLPQFPPDPSLRPHLPCSGTVSYYKKGFPSVKPSTSSPKLLNLLGVDFLEKDSVYLDEYSSSYIGCVNTESSYFSSIKV